MKTLEVRNKYGIFSCLFDDEDYTWITSLGSVSINYYGYPLVYIRGGKPYGKKNVARMIALRYGIINQDDNVDHINRNKLDSRKENLRPCNQSQNGANKTKYKAQATSIYKGVCSYKDKWQANIKVDQDFIAISTFLTERDAAIAYDIKAVEYFGEYAVLNIPNATDEDKTRVAKLIVRQKRHHNTSSKYYAVYYVKANKNWGFYIRTPNHNRHKSGYESELEAALARNKYIDDNQLATTKTQIE